MSNQFVAGGGGLLGVVLLEDLILRPLAVVTDVVLPALDGLAVVGNPSTVVVMGNVVVGKAFGVGKAECRDEVGDRFAVRMLYIIISIIIIYYISIFFIVSIYIPPIFRPSVFSDVGTFRRSVF